jgi:acetoin utilization deacetylase AcuC-like enzyme
LTTTICWDDAFAVHDTGRAAMYLYEGGLVEAEEQHIDNPRRGVRLRRLLTRAGLDEMLRFVTPEPATVQDIERAHAPEHVRRMREVSASGGGDAGGGYTPMDGRSYDLALLSAGSAIACTRDVLDGRTDNAYAMVRRAGHHAWREQGYGFCIFNNCAVAARWAQATEGIERVAVIDIDVHHGNGSEAIFWEDPSVLTISLHQDSMFPPDTGAVTDAGGGAGIGTNVNVPLPAGVGDGGYHFALDRIVDPVVRAFSPELLIVACGLDGSVFDPMARLSLTAKGFAGVAERLLRLARDECGGRLVLVQEGGYSPVYAPFCGLAMIETIACVPVHADPFQDFLAPVLAVITDAQRDEVEGVATALSRHWPVLAAARPA